MLGKIFGHILLKVLCKTGGILTTKGRIASSKVNRRPVRKNGMGMRIPAGFVWYQRTHADMLTNLKEKSTEDK